MMKRNFLSIIAIALAITALLTGTVAAEILAESPHPYPDEYDNAWNIADPNASQMRLHFQRYHLATSGDMIRLYYSGDFYPRKTINGDDTNQENVWTEWYTTNFLKVRFTSDSIGDEWGFLVDQKEIRSSLTCPLTDPGALAESCHEYANDYDYTWSISEPGATQIRIHFQRYNLSDAGDTIRLYDGNDVLLDTIWGVSDRENVWTGWYGTDTIKIRLTTDRSGTTWGFLVDQKESNAAPTAPASIINLHNVTYQQTSITWNWTDPASADFDHAIVYIDGVFKTNVTGGIQTYSATGLSPSTAYTISTRTAGSTGLINQSWVNHTATTAPEPPVQVAPESVSNLHNVTYQQTSITWNWTDPSSADFDHVIVYLDGAFQTNVTEGIQSFTAQGMSPSTSHTIATRTAGTTGLINQSWVNHTATTAPEPPVHVVPESVSNLHNVTYQQTSITWNWTDPSSADFDHVIVYLDGAFQTNVTEGIQSFTAQGMSPSTSHTIATRTAGTTGLINQSWVNHTAATSPSPDALVFKVTLNEGWNIFSTPVLLEENQSQFSQAFPEVEQEKILVALGWDGAQWYCPAGSDNLQPLYAYFIKVADGEIANATLVPSNVPSAPPERIVNKGMNLIGIAPAYDPGTQSFPEMPLDEALVTIEEIGELPGYTIVISPSLNQPGWSYAKGGQVYQVQTFKGYWVFMNNGPDTLAGFSTTPIT